MIGFVLAIALVIRGLAYLSEHIALQWLWAEHLIAVRPLKMVGEALMLSAGFELAYMLFTHGPDEAIEPLILGAAATALIVVSDDPFSIVQAAILLLIIFSIGILFYVKERFMKRMEVDL